MIVMKLMVNAACEIKIKLSVPFVFLIYYYDYDYIYSIMLGMRADLFIL